MNEIRQRAQAAIEQINRRADEILEEMALNHFETMQWLDIKEERRGAEAQVSSCLAPHLSFDSWWNSLEDDERWEWQDLYGRYQYGPDGDMAINGQNQFAVAVMSFLRDRDSYQKQPFCAYCDSRGHESGACIRATIDGAKA